jgi:opacity protein-like surface antigen
LSLGFYGSIIVDPLDTTNVLRFPYLKEHRFSLIQVPVYLHYQFSKNGKVKPYMNIGFVSDFKFNEFERYQDDDTSQGGAEHLEFWAKDSGLDFFSLAFNLGLGLSIAMGDNLSLLIEHSGNIWEYRKGNEKFKENGEMLFESKILALSRLSLNLGVAYKF